MVPKFTGVNRLVLNVQQRLQPFGAEPVLVANPGVPSEGKYYCRGLVQGDGKGGVKLSRFGRQTIEMMLFSGGGD